MKKSIALLLGLTLPTLACASLPIDPPNAMPLTLLESHVVPLPEISGMAWRRDPATQKRELVLVGDRETKIAIADWENRADAGLKSRIVDLTGIVPAGLTGQAEWESVFSDSTGRVFLARENPPALHVVAPDLKKLEMTIELAIEGSLAGSLSWDVFGNEGAEGIVPLSNGHVLLVKEKNPLRVVEFAPLGAKAQGYRPELAIDLDSKFPLPSAAKKKLVPVAIWSLPSELEAFLEDSSSIEVDPAAGALHLLADQKNAIAEIGMKLDPLHPQLSIERYWTLPKPLKQPEGLLIDSARRPIVAIDHKKLDKPNVFLLSTLE